MSKKKGASGDFFFFFFFFFLFIIFAKKINIYIFPIQKKNAGQETDFFLMDSLTGKVYIPCDNTLRNPNVGNIGTARGPRVYEINMRYMEPHRKT